MACVYTSVVHECAPSWATAMTDLESQQWVSQTYASLVAALTLFCGDVSTAEDCAQEALIRLWQHGRRVQSPQAWVFRCAFNIATSTARRRSAERRALARNADQRRHPVEQAAQIERDVDLMRGLSALPQRQRQALLLHYMADMDLTQVGAVMRCSTGTVKAHLARGLASLRRSNLIIESAEANPAEEPQ